jgi:hypothetical protein
MLKHDPRLLQLSRAPKSAKNRASLSHRRPISDSNGWRKIPTTLGSRTCPQRDRLADIVTVGEVLKSPVVDAEQDRYPLDREGEAFEEFRSSSAVVRIYGNTSSNAN